MNDLQRVLGALKEHKHATDRRLDRIESKLDRIQIKFAMIMGAGSLFVLVVSIITGP